MSNLDAADKGFPVELDTGETVRIVEKKPDPQLGTVMVTSDGRTIADDYNTIAPAYEVGPVEEDVVDEPSPPVVTEPPAAPETEPEKPEPTPPPYEGRNATYS